jgi:hypothetical protein
MHVDQCQPTVDTPHSADNSNGNMVVSVLNGNSAGNPQQPQYALFDPWGNQQTGWGTDTSGEQTYWAVQLTANGNFVYALITELGSDGQFMGERIRYSR